MKRLYISFISIVLSLTLDATAAIYRVTNTNDSGPGSLRAAVAAANSAPSDDSITFSISDCPKGVCTIVLTSGHLAVGNGAGTLTISNHLGPGSLILEGHQDRIFWVSSSAQLAIDGVTLQNGDGNLKLDPQCGGAIFNDGGSLSVSNSVLRNNSAGYGGAICNSAGSVAIARSEIVSNSSSVHGGGIYSIDGSILIQDSTVSNNTADLGGGIAVVSWSNFSSNGTIANSTISGNHAALAAGGLYLVNGETPLRITNSTITMNMANEFGAGIFAEWYGGSMYSRNNLIAGNEAPADPDIADYWLVFHDLGNNFIGGSPLLGPLGNNGGPTRTHALLPGSPAINSGNSCVVAENGCGDGNPSLATDQRGVARNGTVDIGAFEFQTQLEFEVAGRVIAATGRAIPGARVVLIDGSGNRRLAVTSTFGYFRFFDVQAGNYKIVAIAKGYEATASSISVNAPITNLELILTRAF